MDDYLVIGVGSRLRGDDAVGLLVVEELETRGVDASHLLTSDGDPGELLDAWCDRGFVVLVDAMCAGVSPGTVEVFDASGAELPAAVRLASSHAVGAATAVEIGRALGRLPPKVVVVGIEASRFEVGSSPTPEVRNAVTFAADAVLEAVGDA